MANRALVVLLCAICSLVIVYFILATNVEKHSDVSFINSPTFSSVGLLQRPPDWKGTYKLQRDYSKSEQDFMQKYSSCEKIDLQSSGVHSHIRLLHVEQNSNTFTVIVMTMDSLKRTKMYGGDVIFLWAEQDQTKTRGTFKRAAGTVEDLNNGSYLGSIQIPWSGPTKIKAKIASKLGHACRRFQAMVRYGNSVFATNTPYGLYFEFKNKDGSETTRCSPLDKVYGYEEVCNLTYLNFGLTFSCGQPKKYKLKCADFYLYGMCPYPKSALIFDQNKTDVIHGKITETFKEEVNVNFELEIRQEFSAVLPECANLNPKYSWNKTPSGIAVGGTWISRRCKSRIDINRVEVAKCMNNKKVFFLGDSTIRQYHGAIADIIKAKVDVDKFHLSRETRTEDGISMKTMIHAMPFYNDGIKFSPHGIGSIAHHLRKIANNHTIAAQDIIIGINYNSHLQAFPVSVYKERIRDVLKGIKYLLRQKPGAKILFKGPHHCSDPNKWFDARVVEMYRDILFEEFASVQDSVIYLDVLSITIAFDNEALHPAGDALNAHIYQFLSYIC